MLAATFWDRLQEAPFMALRIAGTLLLVFLCFGIMGFVGLTVWSVLTEKLRIPGNVIIAALLALVGLGIGWDAVQDYAQAKTIQATGISPDPDVSVEQACRYLNGDARVNTLIAFALAAFAMWFIWQWRHGVERERFLNMTEEERLLEKTKDPLNVGQ